MAMQTNYFKEHEELAHNSTTIGQPWPWWSALGSQSLFGESCAQLKPFSSEQPVSAGLQFLAAKPGGGGTELGIEKRTINHNFNIFPGDIFSGDWQKSQRTITLSSSLPEYIGEFKPGFDKPTACAKYPRFDQYCGVFSYGHQISGRILLPLNLTADNGQIYVNPKQYRGIIRRRLSRAKAAVLLNKIPRARKPYMHKSRHLHAMRRPRGCGGRFLNTKNPENKKSGSEPQGSEAVPQPDCRTHNRAHKEGTYNSNSNNNSSDSSEYSGENHLSLFKIDHIHAFAAVMNTIDDVIIPAGPKWIGAADHGCINLKA